CPLGRGGGQNKLALQSFRNLPIDLRTSLGQFMSGRIFDISLTWPFLITGALYGLSMFITGALYGLSMFSFWVLFAKEE
ncbi:hypothetical protein B6U96_17395, partial [Archaeoglobales archaeon ex4484_92]